MRSKPCTWAIAALLAALAHAAAAHGDATHPGKPRTFRAAEVEERAFGREGDPAKVTRVIRIGMSDAFRYTPSDITVRRGTTVKFLLHNEGQHLHEMVLGTADELKAHAELMKKFPDMEHADAHMAHVPAGARGEIIWQFTRAGVYEFACLIPGHYEAGMVGRVRVR